MRFWWVNQNQTFRQELDGGYIWSPKTRADGHRNHFYETMREVAPGDLIFSFVDTRIPAIGIARSYCQPCPKPSSFGHAGRNWENVGWQVKVSYTRLAHRIRPKDHMQLLGPLLPSKYAPLQPTGDGKQAVYLAEISEAIARTLLGLIGVEAHAVLDMAQSVPPAISDDLEDWDQTLEENIARYEVVRETERVALVQSRRGQGIFKDRVSRIEKRCRITGVDNPAHLIGSHCKPWRDSSNEERLNGENGLLLTPSIDHLFDRGFISFEDQGDLIISPAAHKPSLQSMGVETQQVVNVGRFTEGQRVFLDFHRNAVLLMSARR